MECLTCGSKEVDPRRDHVFCVPGVIMVSSSSYLLCEEHKNVRYEYEDIYTKEGNRKKIDHEAVIKRSMEKS